MLTKIKRLVMVMLGNNKQVRQRSMDYLPHESVIANDEEALVRHLVSTDRFLDMRSIMPRGKARDWFHPNPAKNSPSKYGFDYLASDGGSRYLTWPKVTLAERLGLVLHQSASANCFRVVGTGGSIGTADYHVSATQHILPQRSLPGICYDFAIPDFEHPSFASYIASLASEKGFDPQSPEGDRLALSPRVWIVGSPCDRKFAQGSERHLGDENRHLLSMLVMGDFSGSGYKQALGVSKNPTNLQCTLALAGFIALRATFRWSAGAIFGHADFGKAACPGYMLMDLVDNWRGPHHHLLTALHWQLALLRWNPNCLPKHGADGTWGYESQTAISQFQRAHNINHTTMRDPFTELMLLAKYPRIIA